MSTYAAKTIRKYNFNELATETRNSQSSTTPMGNPFLSVSGNTVTKGVILQQQYGTRLQSARPSVQQSKTLTRPTTTASKRVPAQNSWRPPLQRTKQASSLPSIERGVLASRQNDLVYCEEQSGEEDSDRFRNYHDRLRLNSAHPGKSTSRAIASATTRRLGVGSPYSQPITRPLLTSKSLPSFESERSSSTGQTTCVDTLLHEVLQSTAVKSNTTAETWSHPLLEKRSGNSNGRGSIPDDSSKSSYGVYLNAPGVYPKVLQPLAAASRTAYSATGTADHEFRRPLAERTALSFQNSRFRNPSSTSSNHTEQTVCQVVPPVDSGVCITDETLTLKNVNGLLELEQHVTDPEITKVVIHRIDFKDLAPHLFKLQASENLLSLELQETSLKSLRQLESLVQLRNLQHLTVTPGNNPITHLSTWIPYLVHRMGHLALTTINGKQITTDMIKSARQLFGPVVQLVRTVNQRRRGSRAEAASQQTLLQRKDDQSHDDCLHKTNWPVPFITDTEKEIISASKEVSRNCVEQATRKCTQSLWKEWLAQKTWPSILNETVEQILDELADFDTHMKSCMAELEK